MIVQIFFSTSEIKQFFEDNGFQIVTITLGKWNKAYHNREEWTEYPADAIRYKNNYIEISELFREVSQLRLKSLIAPASEDIKQLIETTINKHLKSI